MFLLDKFWAKTRIISELTACLILRQNKVKNIKTHSEIIFETETMTNLHLYRLFASYI